MKIGLTYDLRDDYRALGFTEEEVGEFDRPETVDGLERAIRSLGFETQRVGHIKSLVNALARGERWDLVFNIAEGVHGLGREAQVPALLEAYEIPCTFSDSLTLAVCLHKGFAKTVVRAAGVPTPDFAVVERPEDLDRIAMPFPLFVKPVGEGTGKGITADSRVTTREELGRVVLALLERCRQPVLVEEYLPGREFTVGVIGTGAGARAIGAVEVVLTCAAEPLVYSYFNKENWEGRLEYRKVEGPVLERCQQTALEAWRALGCRDGGRVDLRMDAAGAPHFLEANPLAGLDEHHSDLPLLARHFGMGYEKLIEGIVYSALRRAAMEDGRRE